MRLEVLEGHSQAGMVGSRILIAVGDLVVVVLANMDLMEPVAVEVGMRSVHIDVAVLGVGLVEGHDQGDLVVVDNLPVAGTWVDTRSPVVVEHYLGVHWDQQTNVGCPQASHSVRSIVLVVHNFEGDLLQALGSVVRKGLMEARVEAFAAAEAAAARQVEP